MTAIHIGAAAQDGGWIAKRPGLAGEFVVPGRSSRIRLKKLRSDYTEFAAYWPLTTGAEWIREYCTNRLNTGNAGMPRRVAATLSMLTGSIDTGTFDDLDFPASPSGVSLGTHVLIGTGNTELAVSVRKPADDISAVDFCSGTHGHETNPSGMVVKADGVTIDYAAAANGATWVASVFIFTYRTTLVFPSDGTTEFATVDWVQTFDQDGYRVGYTFTYTAAALVHNHYGMMLQAINRSGTTVFADSVGGGMDSLFIEFEQFHTLQAYDNGQVAVQPRRGTAAFYNGDYAIGAFASIADAFDGSFVDKTFRTASVGLGLTQDRTDGMGKFYNRIFSGDPTNGVAVAPGASYSYAHRFRIAKGTDFATRFAAL